MVCCFSYDVRYVKSNFFSFWSTWRPINYNPNAILKCTYNLRVWALNVHFNVTLHSVLLLIDHHKSIKIIVLHCTWYGVAVHFGITLSINRFSNSALPECCKLVEQKLKDFLKIKLHRFDRLTKQFFGLLGFGHNESVFYSP